MRALERAWRSFFFREESCLPLELVRIGLGISLFFGYLALTPSLGPLLGPDGWVDPEAARGRPWAVSIFFLFPGLSALYVAHGLMLVSSAALAAGWRTGIVKWLVLVLHLSYGHRNPWISYGADYLLNHLLILLALAPVGNALAIDARGRGAGASRDAWGFACLRLTQIQMAVLFFFSGTTKLQGVSWWSGDAFWISVMNPLFAWIEPEIVLSVYWLANLFTWGTIIVEVGYPFLVWGRETRPWFLAAAIGLHLGIALLLGIWFFAAVAIAGHLAFVRPEWLVRWVGTAREPKDIVEGGPAPAMIPGRGP